MSPRVSVIIPAYNRERTIARAISSVMTQSYQDFEIIVADDASQDSTVATVEHLHCERIRILTHDNNAGAAAARNTAIRAARGEYVAFLDSDDAWFPGKLDAQLAALRSCVSAGVSCTGVILHLIDRGISCEYALPDCDDWQRRLALGCDMRPGSTLLARRQVFEQVGLMDEDLRRFEDWDWMLRYATSGARVLILSEPMAHIYNVRGRLGIQSEKSALHFLNKHRTLFEALDLADRRQSKCDLWLQIATTYALEGRFLDATRLALRGLLQSPSYAAGRLVRHGAEYASLRWKSKSNTQRVSEP